VFEVHELNSLGDSMVERGIRLHKGLEEVVVPVEMEEKGREWTESEDDEIEHNARELRRLKPY